MKLQNFEIPNSKNEKQGPIFNLKIIKRTNLQFLKIYREQSVKFRKFIGTYLHNLKEL